MPYHVHEEDGKYHVRKEGSEHNLGTHDTKEEADQQIAAIEAEEHREDAPRTDPPAPPKGDNLSEIVHGLSERLSTIEGVIAGMASGEGHSEKDETPVKVPWTHRKFG